MKITTRGSYTLRALLDLARHSIEGGPVRLLDISRREGISRSYLEQLFHRLKLGGFVEGQKGPGGGYLLTRSPETIPVGEVLLAVEGEENLFLCSEEGEGAGGHSCGRYRECVTHTLWERLSRRVHDFLNGITLADLLREEEAIERNKETVDG